MIARCGKHLLCIAEDHVYTAPLLKHCQRNAEEENTDESGIQQGEQVDLFASRKTRSNLRQGLFRIGLAVEPSKDALCFVVAAIPGQPARAFRHCQHSEKK